MNRLILLLFNLFIFTNSASNNNLIGSLYSIFVNGLNKSKCNKTIEEIDELSVILNSILKNYLNVEQNNVVDCVDLENINIFCGDISNCDNNFLEKINRCKTHIGKYMLAYMLSNPTENLSEILDNQSIVKLLLNDDNIKVEIEELITKFSEIEKSIVNFYNEKSEMYGVNIDPRIVRRFYFKNRNNSNKSVRTLYARKVFTDLFEIMIKPYYSGLSITLYLTSFFMMFDSIVDNLFLKISQFVPIPAFKEVVIIFNIGNIVKALNKKKSIIAGGLFVGGVVTSVFSFINLYRKFSSYKSDYRKIFNIVRNFQIFIKEINKLLKTVGNNRKCKIIFSKIGNIKSLFEYNNGYELDWLIRFLLRSDLNCTYLSHNSPSVLAAFNVLSAHRDVFINVLCEFIQLDVYLSMCKLICENSKEFSFTKFIKSVRKPIVILKDLWSPLINNSNVVKNDLEIGEGFNTMLLCGHNGGGKSTYLRSIVLNLILIQTFGVSMSKYSVITVFHKINISLDVNDDINIGDSLYKSEIKRLHSYLKLCEYTAGTDKFIFSVFEEPLKGTDSKSAVSILLGMFKYLSKTNSNLINIVSSHYNQLLKLEKLPMFRNFYPGVKVDGKKLIYLYKIKQGFIDKSLAIPIAEQIGINDGVIRLIKNEYNNYDL